MNIETLINEAKARQEARTTAYREEQERRAIQAGDTLRNQFIAAFGDDFLATIGGYLSSRFDDVARITFRYQERNFSMRRVYSDGTHDWVLTWLAPRDDDDDRRQQYMRVSESRHDGQVNVDSFVLALDELAAAPDVPRQSRSETTERPARVMDEFEEQLIDSLRQWMQSAL